MTTTYLLLAGLATVPSAGMTWLLGALVDRLAPPAYQRLLFWSVAIWVIPLTFVAVLTGIEGWLPHQVLPAHVYVQPSSIAPIPAAAMGAFLISARHQSALPNMLAILWSLGIAFRLVRLVRKYLLVPQLKTLAAVALDPKVSDQLSTELQLGGAIRIRCSAFAASPMVLGIAKPIIVLPLTYRDNAGTIASLVCKHELQHIRQRDNISLLVEEVILALFWYNPIMAAIRSRLISAREEVCDSVALHGTSEKQRKLYAQALTQTYRKAVAVPTSSFIGLGRRHEASRLSAILSPKSPKSKPAILGLSLAAALAGCVIAGSVASAVSNIATQPFGEFTERTQTFAKLTCSADGGQISVWRAGTTKSSPPYIANIPMGGQVSVNVATWSMAIRPGLLQTNQIGITALLDNQHKPAQLTYLCYHPGQQIVVEIAGKWVSEPQDGSPHLQTFMLSHYQDNYLAFESLTTRGDPTGRPD